MVKIVSFCLLSLSLLAAASPAPAGEREGCAICGMYLDLYAKSRYTITFDDGSSQSTCSLACAARTINDRTGHIKDIKAGDFVSGELIDARSAFILEGSDVHGVMSSTSRIAFSSQKAAQDFQKQHGGKIITFEEALRNQLKEQH